MGSMTIETTTFETTFILHLLIWDQVLLRPIHLRPHDIHMRLFYLRSHSFYTMLKWSCFDLLRIRFLWSAFRFFAGDLKFCKVTIQLKVCNVTSFHDQGWLALGCKCTRTLQPCRGQKTLNTSGLEESTAPRVVESKVKYPTPTFPKFQTP